jgi:glutathione S-transferase
VRLYHRSGAGRPIRVAWTLEELGVQYELVRISPEEGAGSEHRSRHPLGRVPVLEDDDGAYFESAGLCLHVADLHPEAGLVPLVGTRERALLYQWLFFSMTELEPPMIENYRWREKSPEVADTAAERVRRALAVIDDALDGREYMVGGRFSVADVVTSEVVRATVRLGALDPSVRISEYLSAMEARPARQRAAAQLSS